MYLLGVLISIVVVTVFLKVLTRKGVKYEEKDLGWIAMLYISTFASWLFLTIFCLPLFHILFYDFLEKKIGKIAPKLKKIILKFLNE